MSIQNFLSSYAVVLLALALSNTADAQQRKTQPNPAAPNLPAASKSPPPTSASSAPDTSKSAELLKEGARWASAPSWLQPALENKVRPTEVRFNRGRVFTAVLDTQTRVDGPRTVSYTQQQLVPLDNAVIREVSEFPVDFNPAYQKLALHHIRVVRDGKVIDKAKDVRIDVLRREQNLERRILDGLKTALIVIPNVLAGDTVDIAFSIEGRNPIFEEQFAELEHVVWAYPVGTRRIVIDAPSSMVLKQQSIGGRAQLIESQVGNRRLLQLTSERIEVPNLEANTPPWVKIYPSIHISSYASWKDVHSWATKLFAPTPNDPQVVKLASDIRQRGLKPADEVAHALSLAQEEVRYLSVSLGESSHRPKAPSKTWEERLGDCKDKVLLLNSVLKVLGYDAQAVLVSVRRHRAMLNYFATHAEFDHVISRVKVNDQYYLLDPTIMSQGRGLDSRGYIDYGAGLIVGDGNEPQKLELPSFAKNELSYQQSWDFSQMKNGLVPVTLEIRGQGLAADGLRRMIDMGQSSNWVQYLQNRYTRAYEGLKLIGDVKWDDNRGENVLTGQVQFQYEGKLKYEEGRIQIDVAALELIDFLQVPPEPSRSMPFYLDDRSTQRYALRIRPPHTIQITPQSDRPFGEDHIEAMTSVRSEAPWFQFDWTIRNKAEEVSPAQAARFREKVAEMRRVMVRNLRLPLWDLQDKRAELDAFNQQVTRQFSRDRDRLDGIKGGYEFDIKLGEYALQTAKGMPRLTADIYTYMAIAAQGLGRSAVSLGYLDAADAAHPASKEERVNERISTLLALGNSKEALVAARQPIASNNDKNDYWPSLAEYYLGDKAKAIDLLEKYSREATGEAREFAKLWLYLIAESTQKGAGSTRLQSADFEALESAGFGRQLIRYVSGRMSQDELIIAAKKKKSDERLNLTEAYFFIGKRLILDGKPQEAKSWFQKVLEIKATPYREYALVPLELNKIP
jgi:transglutaminase-like putative cysteine protease